jgi:DNA primase
MGTALTEHQLKTLARSAKKIILALDSDAAGQNATRRSLEVAREALKADYTGRLSLEMRVLHVPGAKDPDDFIRESPEQWAGLVANAMSVADFVIENEIAALPPDVSPRDVESMSQRLAPILLASENSYLNKENAQKLLLAIAKLKQSRRSLQHIRSIPLEDLLGWANEQYRIEAAKPPRAAPTSAEDEGPDFPPTDYDAMLPPPPEWDEGEEPAHPSAAPKQQPISREADAERHCLRILFQNPDLYYTVNRKFRELANGSRTLMDGPLRDWDADDFVQSEYRALMQVFQTALGQDDLDVMDYLRAELDSTLLQQLETIMIGELEDIRSRVRYSLSADLSSAWNQNQRMNPITDWSTELIEKALRLRSRRLQQEREELCLLQIDSQTNGDATAGVVYGQQVHLSGQAKRLIDSELDHHISILRK